MSELRKANALNPTFDYDPTDPAGYRAGIAHLDKTVGGAALAVKAFELPPGESVCPYHYEYEEAANVRAFCLTNARLPASEQTARFVGNIERILRQAEKPGPYIFGVYEGYIKRLWP